MLQYNEEEWRKKVYWGIEEVRGNEIRGGKAKKHRHINTHARTWSSEMGISQSSFVPAKIQVKQMFFSTFMLFARYACVCFCRIIYNILSLHTHSRRHAYTQSYWHSEFANHWQWGILYVRVRVREAWEQSTNWSFLYKVNRCML